MRTALLVVDVQRSLLEEGPWEKGKLLEKVGTLVGMARRSGVLIVFLRDTCVQPDGEIDAGVHRGPDDLVIQKDFSDSFVGTALHEQLQHREIERLVVCGLQTDYCVDTTCRRAASLGYTVHLVSDAHTTFDRHDLSAARIVDHHNWILRNFPSRSGLVMTVPLAKLDFAGTDSS